MVIVHGLVGDDVAAMCFPHNPYVVVRSWCLDGPIEGWNINFVGQKCLCDDASEPHHYQISASLSMNPSDTLLSGWHISETHDGELV